MNLSELYGAATSLPTDPVNSLEPSVATMALASRGDGVLLSGATGIHAGANGYYSGGEPIDGHPAFYGPEGSTAYAIARLAGLDQYALYRTENIVHDADAELWFLGTHAAGPVREALLGEPFPTVYREGYLPDARLVDTSLVNTIDDLPAATTQPLSDENTLGTFSPVEDIVRPEQPAVIPHTEQIESGVHTRVFVQYRTSPVVINLPETPTENQWVEIIDGSLQADVYPIAVDPSSATIEAQAGLYPMETPGAVLELIHREGNWKIL